MRHDIVYAFGAIPFPATFPAGPLRACLDRYTPGQSFGDWCFPGPKGSR
jgi:hypothetical protein